MGYLRHFARMEKVPRPGPPLRLGVPFTGRTIGFKNIQTKVGNAQSVERGTLRFFAGSL